MFLNKIEYMDKNPVFDDPTPEKKFREHYKQNILPYVEQFEEERIGALSQYRVRCFITFAIMLAAFIGACLAPVMEETRIKLIFFLVVVFGGLMAWASAPLKTYQSSVKEIIFPKIFSYFGPNFSYSPTSFISVESLKDSQIIPSYQKESTEDYVKGSYADINIELMEAKLTMEEGSGKSRRTVTVFKGAFIFFDMKKKFLGKTIMKRDRGKMGNWFNSVDHLKKVGLVDPKFEKEFEVYSNDQVEARYILSPTFMENIVKLNDIYGGAIQCSFYANRMLIMLSSMVNRFEVGSPFEPATFEKEIKDILSQMQAIFQMIDILKLYSRNA